MNLAATVGDALKALVSGGGSPVGTLTALVQSVATMEQHIVALVGHVKSLDSTLPLPPQLESLAISAIGVVDDVATDIGAGAALLGNVPVAATANELASLLGDLQQVLIKHASAT